MMHSAICHHPQTNAQPIPEQQPVVPGQLPRVCILSMMFYGMKHLCGQFGSGVLAVLFPCLLAEHEKLKSPGFRVSATSNN